MRCFPSDHAAGISEAMEPLPTQPERLAPEIGRPGDEAECATLEALTMLLATASREAHRVTEWEGMILAELQAPFGQRRAAS